MLSESCQNLVRILSESCQNLVGELSVSCQPTCRNVISVVSCQKLYSNGYIPSTSGRNLYCCTNPVKNRKSSVFANVSPKHCLFPTEKGMKYLFFKTFPSSSKNLCGLNTFPSPQWSPFSTSVIIGVIMVLAGIVCPKTSMSLDLNKLIFFSHKIDFCLGVILSIHH